MSGGPATAGWWSRSFPGSADQVRQARRYLAGLLDGFPAIDEAVLCLSELAANAVLHSRSGHPGGTFTVRVATGPAVCVEVDDQGGPWVSRSGLDGSRGRGLGIIRELACDFGIDGDQSGRTAWFTMKGDQ